MVYSQNLLDKLGLDVGEIINMKMAQKVEQEIGFRIARHRGIFERICPKCAKQLEKNNDLEV